MENITHLRPAAPEPDFDVVVLCCPDRLHFDPAPLTRLFSERDFAEAEEVVCRALEDIALRLEMLQNYLAASDFDNMAKPARRIGLVADQIGLMEVSIAAHHVAICLHQREGVALEATMARLERSFDVAVAEVWNFREYED
ncbi:hypothetical protein [Yoonia sp. SS1-5]|uniref:Uncharacterized protein n=1 Tax=Yoonia rhodophyticola TaxID=3137370 RepID=A0AAN0MCM6_9RHOB